MKLTGFVVVGTVVASLVGLYVAGCNGERTGIAASKSAASPQYANQRCPIEGNQIVSETAPAELTRDYEGETVVFCSSNCPETWDGLTGAEKQAKLPKTADDSPGRRRSRRWRRIGNVRIPI